MYMGVHVILDTRLSQFNHLEFGMRMEKMRVCRDIYSVLIVATIVFSTGCSSFDALVRSVENPFSRKQVENDPMILDEAREAYQSGNAILSEERYKEYVEKNQRTSDKVSLAYAYAQLGRIAHEKSDFKASQQHFEKAIELDPNNLDHCGMYAESLYWQKDYKRSESLFKQAMQAAPDDTRFQIMLGHILAEQKKYQLGHRYLKQALGEQGAYEAMAQIYNKHGEYEMAALAMSKVRESRKRQLAVNSGSGSRHQASSPADSAPQTLHPDNTMQALQSIGSMQMQTFYSPQPASPQQEQLTVMQQIVRQQQNANGQQVPMQQSAMRQFASQFPPQQSVMSANHGYPQPLTQSSVPMNPAVQQEGITTLPPLHRNKQIPK